MAMLFKGPPQPAQHATWQRWALPYETVLSVGGEALAWLHENAGQLLAMPGESTANSAPPVRVHMDTMACMTGVSRFGQVMPSWQYFKVSL